MKWMLRLAAISPYFAAIIAWRMPAFLDEEAAGELFQRYTIFLAFFCIWSSILGRALDLYRYRKIDSDPTQITLKQVKIWFLFLLLLASMELIRTRVDRSHFVFILGLMIVVAGGMSGRIHGKPWLALLGTTAAHIGVAYASFIVVTLSWDWQPILFAAGIGLASAAAIIAGWWASLPELLPVRGGTSRYYRTLTTMALAAPVSIGILALSRQLPFQFLLVYTTLFWLSKTAAGLGAETLSAKDGARHLAISFLAIVAILIVCRIWEYLLP